MTITEDKLIVGRVGRREMLGLLGAGVLARRFAPQEPEPQFSALDHIEFYVSNAEQSRDFFVGIFGNALLSRAAKRYLKLGSTYMAFEPPRGNATAGQVDHVSAAIKRLDMTRLHAFLQERGIAYQDYPSGRDTAVIDPDGTRLQLSPENGWSLLTPPNFAPETVTLTDDPVFRPVGLDHILLNAGDLEKSAAFYRKILGSPIQRDGGGVWFQTGASRIGVTPASAGQRAGVRHLAVSVAAFNYESTVRRLGQIGAKVEPAGAPGTAAFRTLDGLLIQAIGTRA